MAPPKLHARSRWLLGPLRPAGVDATSTHLVMHTFQHRAVWEDLVREGIHRPPRWGEDHDFAEAYGWMHTQMAGRLPTSSDGIVWLWAQHDRRWFRPMRPEPGDVLLTCRVPRAEVLVSHFSDWHCVLNRCPLVPPLPGESDDGYGRRLDQILDRFFSRCDAADVANAPLDQWPNALRAEVEATWTGIFDVGQWGKDAALQGTVHELRLEHVVRAVQVR